MADFDWNNYLEVNKTVAVPEELFTHVETSVDNGIKQGMLLEVCHKNNPDIYWIAEITMVCGHLLRIKFIGATTDFWCDISTTKVHPLGWCGKSDEMVEPPLEINQKYGDQIIDIMKKTLVDGLSVSMGALNNKGQSPIDRIKVGMKVEVQNVIDPYRYWIATVGENVGGRLLLRYDGADDDLTQFWIFYTNPRLSTFGYVTNKGSPWQFKYPGKVNKFSCKNKLSTQLRQSAEESIKEPTPGDLLQPKQNLESHNFVTGMKLEALDPQDMKYIRPATVTKVFNNLHFLVVIDDHTDDYEDAKMGWVCDSMNPYIYPIGWAQKNSLGFKSPKIWKEGNFDWDEYLTITSSVPAPDYCFGTKTPITGIHVNMKLEAVNPQNHEEIHVANVDTIVEHMLLVELLPIGEKYWFAQDSDLLFPVGWADSHDYALHIPNTNVQREIPRSIEATIHDKSSEPWCERIYFNHKCTTGPNLSRNKFAQLPKHVGPGPLSLVLREILNKLITVAYRPGKTLKDWESTEFPYDGLQKVAVKAKLKKGYYHARIDVVSRLFEVGGYCRSLCEHLGACPQLVSGADFPAGCPDCLPKEKPSKPARGRNVPERRGRPKGSLNGRRKKRKAAPKKAKRAATQAAQESESNRDAESVSGHSATPGSSPPSERGTRPNSPDSGDSKRTLRKKRAAKTSYPKLEMKTRGAKLPNFALQMKEAHWNRKDVQTMYNNSCIIKKRSSPETDTDTNDTSSNSRKNISDVSDSEEPELKKLKFSTYDPQPSDNKSFERDVIDMSWMRGRLKLAANPLDWSVTDVHAYLRGTDCRLLADRLRQEEIDGQALVMLDLDAMTSLLYMKKEFALRLTRHIMVMRWYINHYETVRM